MANTAVEFVFSQYLANSMCFSSKLCDLRCMSNPWRSFNSWYVSNGTATSGSHMGIGGSVTLGVLADMWTPDEQEYAVAFLVLSSVGGSVVGAIIGSFVEVCSTPKGIQAESRILINYRSNVLFPGFSGSN